MRKSVVLTIAGGVVAATMMASFIAANRPANAATAKQCINAGSSCLTKCGVGSVPEEMVQGCADRCRLAEFKCITKPSDAADAKKARDLRNKRKDSGGNKVPPKGGKKGLEVVVDPVRPPNTPVGEQPPAKGSQSTGTWTPPSQTPPPPGSTVKDPAPKTPPARELLTKPFGGTYRP